MEWLKKTLLILALAALLAFSFVSATMASPVVVNEDASFVLFAEYAPLLFFIPEYIPVVGAGYEITDNLIFGVEAQFIPGITFFGLFANYSIDQFEVSGEMLFIEGDLFGKVTALYTIDANALTMGFGGGTVLLPGGIPFFFVEGAANLALGDSFSIYGSVDYTFLLEWITYKAGISIAF